MSILPVNPSIELSLNRAHTYPFVQDLYQMFAAHQSKPPCGGTSAADPYAPAHAVPDAPPGDSQPAHAAAAAPVLALDEQAEAQSAPVRAEAQRIVSQAPAD